eukprot:m.1582741 g.1582741  ORF g.1582741 m.1582741 type:complete len:50 (+) comp25318_c0_seq31:1858-2007(+)
MISILFLQLLQLQTKHAGGPAPDNEGQSADKSTSCTCRIDVKCSNNFSL